MTTFTEKVEELLDKIGDICHEQYLGCEQVDGQYYYSYKNEVVNMLDNQEVRQLIIKAHQAEISRVLERVEALKKERPVSGPNRNGTSECKRKAYNSAITDALEAINKIKGEYK